MELERRALSECRIDADGPRKLSGYAIRFHSLSENLGGFKELVAPEAVDRALNTGADVRALVDHDSGKVIGRTRSGTLLLRKDNKGLRVTIEPDLEISYAADIFRAVGRGDVDKMSFGFRVLSDEWDYDADDMPIRTLTDIELREISIVSFPAYAQTSIEIAQRSLQAFKQTNPQRSRQWYDAKLRLAR